MRFFSSILTLSAALSAVAQSTQPKSPSTDACTAKGCLTITALTIYAPANPTAEDNISLTFDIESGEYSETCPVDWKWGAASGQQGYPTSDDPTTCNQGQFATYFISFTSISQFTIVAKYTFTLGTTGRTQTSYGQATVDKSVLYCDTYLSGSFNRCQLDYDKVADLKLPIFKTE